MQHNVCGLPLIKSTIKSSNVGKSTTLTLLVVCQIDQAPLGMPGRDYYLKGRGNPTLVAYQQFAVDVAKMLRADPTRAEREMMEMVDFEVKLANVRRRLPR